MKKIFLKKTTALILCLCCILSLAAVGISATEYVYDSDDEVPANSGAIVDDGSDGDSGETPVYPADGSEWDEDATGTTGAPYDEEPTEATDSTSATEEPTEATDPTSATEEPTEATDSTSATEEPTESTDSTSATEEPTEPTEPTDYKSSTENPDSADSAEESGLPSSYSSVDEGYVTEIKSQKYNDCWAYASLACLETKLLKEGYEVGSFSTEHLNLWATTRGNGTGWQRTVADGGYSCIALGYLMSWQGAVESSVYDPLAAENEYTADTLPTNLSSFGVTSVKYLDDAEEDEIKRAILDNGAVYACYSQSSRYASNDSLSYYCPKGAAAATGHSVEIVGWDDDYPIENFNSPSGAVPKENGAWLAKNSWGNYNSLGGFFWISYEDAFLFSSDYSPIYTIVSVKETDSTVKLMQNEIYGSTYEFDYVEDSDEIAYMNVFNFSVGYNELDGVIFSTDSDGAYYEIYYVPVERGVPSSDESEWTLLYADEVPYAGYIYADFDNFDLPVGYGAIAVKIDTAELNYGKNKADRASNSIGVSEWLITSDGDMVFYNDSESGESFIYYNGEMTELLDWYLEHEDDSLGGTFVIKAVTLETGLEVSLLGDSNLSGNVDISDVTEIQKYLADMVEFSPVQLLNSDFNQNGSVDINDATAVQKYLAGYKDYF